MMKPISKTQEEDQKGENEEEKTSTTSEDNLAIWDCGSPLYDSYELVSLSHLIERHLMILPSLGGSKRFITQFSQQIIDVDPPMKSNSVGTTKLAKGSSMLARFSGLVERRIMWKRKMFGERKEQPKRMKTTNKLLGFYNRIVSWRK